MCRVSSLFQRECWHRSVEGVAGDEEGEKDEEEEAEVVEEVGEPEVVEEVEVEEDGLVVVMANTARSASILVSTTVL